MQRKYLQKHREFYHFSSTKADLSSIVRAAWHAVTNPGPRRVCPQLFRFADPSRFGNTSRRQSSPVGKPTEAAGARKSGERDGRSRPRQARAYQTALLRTNRRISDPISQAVEDDLRKPR